jgi:uncharacterized protein involved in exopolysaccharide biosynthesis
MNTSTRHNQYHEPAFRQLWQIWKRRKWVALLAFIAPFSAAAGLIAGMPELYRATATILVRQDALMDDSAPGGALEVRLQSISEEILSRSRLQELIEGFDLYANMRLRASFEQVVERMRRDIRFTQKKIDSQWGGGATVAFTLSYQSWDPQTAAKVANTLARLYVEENEQRRPNRDNVAATAAGVDAKLAELKRKLEELRAGFSENYPDIIQLKAEITALERQRSASSHPPKRANGAQENHSEQQFRIIDSAVPPEEPFAPSQIRLVLMALILALGFSGVIVLLVEQFDTSFHQRGELWYYTNLPIMASIPRVLTRSDVWRRRLLFTLLGILAASGLVFLVQTSHELGRGAQQVVWILAQRAV